jgi:hypothetical protein
VKVVVYGQRAKTAHVYLDHVDKQQSKERFYALQRDHGKQVLATNGEPIWLSPSRPLAQRQRNKVTRKALDKIAPLLPPGREPPETNWSKQIVWIEDTRVVAPTEATLLPRMGDKTLLSSTRDDSGETFRYAVNVSALARVTGKDEGAVEVHLLSD